MITARELLRQRFGTATIACLNSGMKRETGSLSRTLPSSIIIITATAVIGFDIEASRKIASFGIGLFASTSLRPCASKWTTLPRRATRVTAPGSAPASICRCTASLIRASRSLDMPTSSGLPVPTAPAPARSGSVSAASAATTRSVF